VLYAINYNGMFSFIWLNIIVLNVQTYYDSLIDIDVTDRYVTKCALRTKSFPGQDENYL